MSVDVKEKLKLIPPGWWSAVFGAAGAGALLYPGNRLLAGALLGGGMLALACYVTPCCASCADAATKPAPAPTQTPPFVPPDAMPPAIEISGLFQTGSFPPTRGCS